MKANIHPIILHCLMVMMILFSSIGIAANNRSISAIMPPTMDEAANLAYSGVYNTTITLQSGLWKGSPFIAGGASSPSVGLVKNFTFTGDIDANGSDERVVFLWESSGGSGTRVYMAVIGYHEGKAINFSTHRLGDRVQLQMGRIFKGNIELDVILAADNDPACCPTHKVLRRWTLYGKDMVEMKPLVLGRLSLSDLEGVDWVLKRLSRDEKIADKFNITLSIEGKKISGSSGCNRYFAGIESGELPGELSIKQPGSTRMLCPGEVMRLESRYLKALVSANKFSFVNGQLALSWKDGEAIRTMFFAPQTKK